MLPVAFRLRRRPEFALAVRRGRRSGRPLLVVHLYADSSATADSPPRAGFVVGRGVGGATVRNQVRRRLQHLVADRLPLLAPGTLLVVRAQPAAAGRSFRDLGADLDAGLRRCGVDAAAPNASVGTSVPSSGAVNLP